jgi:hypothetical protein
MDHGSIQAAIAEAIVKRFPGYIKTALRAWEALDYVRQSSPMIRAQAEGEEDGLHRRVSYLYWNAAGSDASLHERVTTLWEIEALGYLAGMRGWKLLANHPATGIMAVGYGAGYAARRAMEPSLEWCLAIDLKDYPTKIFRRALEGVGHFLYASRLQRWKLGLPPASREFITRVLARYTHDSENNSIAYGRGRMEFFKLKPQRPILTRLGMEGFFFGYAMVNHADLQTILTAGRDAPMPVWIDEMNFNHMYSAACSAGLFIGEIFPATKLPVLEYVYGKA